MRGWGSLDAISIGLLEGIDDPVRTWTIVEQGYVAYPLN